MNFNINIKSKHIFILIMVVAGCYILFGLTMVIFHFEMNAEFEKNLSTGFFIAVAALYFYMNQLRKKEYAARDAENPAAKAAQASPAEPEQVEAPVVAGDDKEETSIKVDGGDKND